MKKIFTFPILFLSVFITLHTQAQDKKITVAVAANMQYAFAEIKNVFEKETNIHVDAVIGASGNLTQQIMQGAPFDIFVSADTSYPQKLYSGGFCAAQPKIYAQGILVLWSVKYGIKLNPDLKFLLNDSIKNIAIANPVTAPYGTAAKFLLEKYGLYDNLKNKIVTGESITQTSQFIATQSADVGFTAKAIVLSNEMKGKGIWIELNQKDYSPIFQSAAFLKYGMTNDNDAASKFYAFLYSSEAKEIYKKFGYLVK